jgi:adhesin transport system outer membrane protein
VLDAEAEAINARVDLVDAEYDGLYAQYRILNATGSLVEAFGLQWPEEALVDDDQDMETEGDNG